MRNRSIDKQGTEMHEMETRSHTLMAVFAHPDDESFGIGGTLARYGADPDVRVVLVCATRGEAGEISDPQLATPERLGEVREPSCAAPARSWASTPCTCSTTATRAWPARRRISIPGPWPRPISTRRWARSWPTSAASGPTWWSPLTRTGGYGHPDHVAIHYHAKAAFAAAADPARYPEQIEAGLEPHQAQKLYYTAIPQRFFRDVVAKMQELGMEIPERYLERLERGHRPARRGLHHRRACPGFLGDQTGGDPVPRHPAQSRQRLCPAAARDHARTAGLGMLPTGREPGGRETATATISWPG